MRSPNTQTGISLHALAPDNETVTSRTTAPIGVFTALAWESAAVRAQLRQVKREGKGVWRAQAGHRAVQVITGGIGLRQTQETLKQFADTPFSAVISVGCAGALIPELHPGQLILAPGVLMQSLREQNQVKRLLIDEKLLSLTRLVAAHAAIPVAEGWLFTSETALVTSAEKLQQGRELDAIAVEMESGAHAAFAQAHGLPFLALRVILDSVNMELPAVSRLLTPEGDIRPLRTATYVATHLSQLSRFLALKRSQTVVARTLRRLCAALFPFL
jgi:adenosylhomocysteine nucleosidase